MSFYLIVTFIWSFLPYLLFSIFTFIHYIIYHCTIVFLHESSVIAPSSLPFFLFLLYTPPNILRRRKRGQSCFNPSSYPKWVLLLFYSITFPISFLFLFFSFHLSFYLLMFLCVITHINILHIIAFSLLYSNFFSLSSFNLHHSSLSFPYYPFVNNQNVISSSTLSFLHKSIMISIKFSRE